MLHCYWVPGDRLAELWPVVGRLVDKAAETQAEWTRDGIVRRVLSGEWRLWMAWDGAAAKALMGVYAGKTDRGEKVCHVSFCVGDDMSSGWPELIEEIEEWARQDGCARMVFTTRPGWARVMKPKGFEMTHAVIEKVL